MNIFIELRIYILPGVLDKSHIRFGLIRNRNDDRNDDRNDEVSLLYAYFLCA